MRELPGAPPFLRAWHSARLLSSYCEWCQPDSRFVASCLLWSVILKIETKWEMICYLAKEKKENSKGPEVTNGLAILNYWLFKVISPEAQWIQNTQIKWVMHSPTDIADLSLHVKTLSSFDFYNLHSSGFTSILLSQASQPPLLNLLPLIILLMLECSSWVWYFFPSLCTLLYLFPWL